MRQVRVGLPSNAPPASGDRSYSIFIDAEPRAAERLAAEVALHAPSAVGLLTDETVSHLHLPRVEAALVARGLAVVPVVVPDGEPSKSLATAERVAQSFAEDGLDRRSLVLALGGGVVGDLGGFVASVFLRGVPYVQVPTTLLAQVDSSVGGKTGVNLPAGKNLVGTFHQPLFVYVDVSALATLSARDVASGLAEVVKHGVIADASLLGLLESRADAARAGEPALLAELVARSCEIKASVVGADERETAEGGRARLNFGHTVGHALESASQKSGDPLRHGEAVALGMLAAARLGVALGVGDPSLEPRLLALLPRLGLPIDLDERLSASTLARIGVDKKRTGAELALVLVDRLGSTTMVRVPPARVSEILLAANPR